MGMRRYDQRQQWEGRGLLYHVARKVELTGMHTMSHSVRLSLHYDKAAQGSFTSLVLY